MRTIYYLTYLTLLLSFTLESKIAFSANNKIALKKDSRLIVFEANTQTTYQGRKEANPMQEFAILANWQQAFSADEFYFKYNNIWRVVRIRKIKNYQHPIASFANDALCSSSYYIAQQLLSDSIKQNDSLELYPMPNGRYVIPKFFNLLPKQCIVYQHNNIWYFRTLTFKQLPSVITP